MSGPQFLGVRRLARGGGDVELALDLPSDLALVEAAVDILVGHTPAGILSPRRIAFNFRTALAEVLANAIVYGNGADPAKVVRVRIDAARDAVRVTVEDEGAGFDPAALPDPTAPAWLEREDGRGLFVVRHLVDRVDWNDAGNVVCLTLLAG